MSKLVPISKKARQLLEQKRDDGSEAAEEACEWLGTATPTSVLVPSDAANSLAAWAGFVIETSAEAVECAEFDQKPLYIGEVSTAATLWLRLLAAGATDKGADPTTYGRAVQYAKLTWKALSPGERAAVHRATRRD